jgi:hypothetical protein
MILKKLIWPDIQHLALYNTSHCTIPRTLLYNTSHCSVLYNDMAPTSRAGESILGGAPALVLRRGLSVNSTQATTLGVIAGYVVVIALLWNLPYVRWSLWPFKVRI